MNSYSMIERKGLTYVMFGRRTYM